ncbi:hypothetical protein [Sodalis ligni]|uniref:hypothetical protein n=1 Tax=Sodalis ligni TaxID=2697027 RepID=UPI001050EB78|nr:hypothetical protein [Sodalis ligni]
MRSTLIKDNTKGGLLPGAGTWMPNSFLTIEKLLNFAPNYADECNKYAVVHVYSQYDDNS